MAITRTHARTHTYIQLFFLFFDFFKPLLMNYMKVARHLKPCHNVSPYLARI